jgi:hypothetical protein
VDAVKPELVLCDGFETHTVHDALQTLPDDAQWYLETF